MNAAEELVGLAFGRLTVTGTVRKGRKNMCECTCSCGRTTLAEPSQLKNGYRTSCGCALGGDRRSESYLKAHPRAPKQNNVNSLIGNQRNLRFRNSD
jgi:hypothetical protein